MRERNIPTGVKSIAILHFVAGVLGFIFGLLVLAGFSVLQNAVLTRSGQLLLGIIAMVFWSFYFLVGIGLWKAMKWARISAIILVCFGILLAIISFIQGLGAINLVGLIINAVIGPYLIFSQKVKETFLV